MIFFQLPRHQIIHCLGQLSQIADLQHITAQRRVPGHVAVTVPQIWRFRIQPNRARGAAGHGGENIEARIVVVVASIADDQKRSEERRVGKECRL